MILKMYLDNKQNYIFVIDTAYTVVLVVFFLNKTLNQKNNMHC